MTNDEAEIIIRGIGAGWTFAQWGDDQLLMWANVLDNVDFDSAAQALGDCLHAERYPPTVATFNGYLTPHQAIRREAMRPVATVCQGSGFIDSQHPCPRCNPALHEIFGSSGKLNLWRNGQPAQQILGYPNTPVGESDFTDTYSATPCIPIEYVDEQDPVVDWDTGRRIARQAHVTDCEAMGVEPMSIQAFMYSLGESVPERTT